LPSSLTRLIAVDNISRNQIITIKADGHANFNGENGAGKTTTLRALLLFFGTKPSDIAKAKGDSFDNFASFYFPRPTSYLVFEYIRDGAVKCVVCSGVNGNTQYQFADCGFSESLFLTSDGAKSFIVNHQQLRLNIESSGSELTKKVGAETYAEIIQSNITYRKKNNNSDTIRLLRSKYSFASQGESFRNIERVLANIFTGSVSIGNIQSALTKILIQDNLIQSHTIQLDEQSGSIDEWFSSRESWLALDVRKNNFMTLSECASKRASHVVQLEELHQHCLTLITHIKQKQLELTDLIRQSTQRESDLRAELNRTREANNKKLGELQSNITLLKREIKELEKIKYGFEEGSDDEPSISELQTLHSNLESYQQQEAQAQQVYNDISQGVKDILSFYEAQEAKIETAKAQLQASSNDVERKAESDFYNASADIRKLSEQKKSSIVLTFDKRKDALRTKVNTLQQTNSGLKVQRDSTAFSDAFRKAIAGVQREIKSVDNDFHESSTELRSIQVNLAQIVNERHNLNNRLIENRQFRQAAIEKQLILKARLENGTLFDYLTSNVPDFTHDIGKILDPNLLARKDLSPRFTNKEHTLFGLSLDLRAINTPTGEARSELSDKILLLDDEIAELEDVIKKNEALLSDINDKIRKKERARARGELELKEVTNYLRQQKIELENITVQAEIDVKERQNITDTEISRNTTQIIDFTEQESKLKSEFKTDLESHQAQLEEEINAAKNRLEKNISRLNVKLQENIGHQNSKLKKLLFKKEADIKAKGLSQSRIDEAKRQQEDAHRTVRRAQAAGERVGRYQRFIKEGWPRHQGLSVEMGNTSRDLTDLKIRTQEDEFKITHELSCISDELQSHTQSLEVLTRESVLVGELIDAFAAMEIEVRTPNTDALSELSVSQSKMKFNALKAELNANNSRGKSEFNILETTFCSTSGTPARKFYEKMRSDIMTQCQINELWWNSAPALLSYIEGEHETQAELLRTSYVLVAKHIVDFSAILMSTHKSLNSLGRKLTSATQSVVERFDAIGNIEIKVSSKLKSLAYFSALEAFADAHENWMVHNNGDLPDERLISKLNNLLQMIGGEKLQVNIDRSFLFEVELDDNGKRKRARSNSEIEALSSTGLNYLIVTAIHLGLINLLRTDPKIKLTCCIDEIGKLSNINVNKLIDLLHELNIVAYSALPNVTPELLKNYPYAYNIVKTGPNAREYHLYTEESRVPTENKILDLLAADNKESN
jgi:hypothetical protein